MRTVFTSFWRASTRRVLLTRLCLDAWPVLRLLAKVYRRWLLGNVRIVAVVGSFGKTTTTRVVREALGTGAGDQYPGNATSYVALNILRLHPRRKSAVLEIGISRLGHMARHADMIRPDVVVVTSIGSEHHRTFKTLEVTRDEKAHMVRMLTPAGVAVLNGDDPNVLWMASQTTARVLTFGMSPTADIRAESVSLEWPTGTVIRVRMKDAACTVRSQLVGEHQVYPILAAIAVGVSSGVSLADCASRLAHVCPARMRLERVPLSNGALLLRDEFKSTQETIIAALRLLSQVPARRRFLVLGDISEPVGCQGAAYRSVGRLFPGAATDVFLLGYVPEKYRPGARAAGFDMSRCRTMRWDIPGTVERLKAELTEGDVVLIKGRDTERLERVALSLLGRDVRCERRVCDLPHRCEQCLLLEHPRPAF